MYEPLWCPSDTNTSIYFSPDLQFIDVDEEFTENITIRNADSLVSIYLNVYYDNDIFEVVKVNLDSLLNPLFENFIVSDDTVMLQEGIIKLGLLGQQDGFTGARDNGTIAQLTLKAKTAFEITALEFQHIEIYKYPVENPPIPIPIDDISVFNALLIEN